MRCNRFQVVLVIAAVAVASLVLTTTTANAAIIDGLVEYWELDGDYSAAVTPSHVGTLTTTGAGSGTFVPGKFGQAIDLVSSAGNQAYVVIGGDENDFDFAGGSMSVSAWFTTESLYTGWQTLVAKGENAAWRVARNSGSGNLIKLSVVGPIGDGELDQQDGSWHHVVGTYDATTGTALYVDGNQLGSTPGPYNLQDVPTAMQIGGNPQAAGRAWDGNFDDVGVWNRALTPDEVSSIWNGGTGASIASLITTGPPPGTTYSEAVLADGPFAYYRLNEAAGPTATNLGTVGPPLDGTYNNASGFTFQQSSLLPSGEDLSVLADGATGSGGTEIRLPDNAALNTGAHDNKTVELWFEADSITSTRSVLYEQGGNTRGISIYLEEVAGEDTLFMGAWNLAESNWPVTFVSTPVSEDTPYYAVFVLDGDPDGDDNTNDGFVRGYLDGELIGTTAGAGNLRAHGNNTAAMGIWENVRYADGATQSDGANVAGFLDELALYNIKLDDPNNDGDLSDSRVLAHFNAAGGGAAAIPEPSTFALAALGLLGLGFVGWRRRK